MLKFIVGENNAGKSRYLRREYQKLILANKETKVKWALENPKYFIDEGVQLLNNEIWDIYLPDKFNASIYFNNNRNHNLSNNLDKLQKNAFGVKGLSTGLNGSFDIQIDLSDEDYILKMLGILQEKQEEINYISIIEELFNTQTTTSVSAKTAYFVPTIRNIEFNQKEVENINFVDYVKEYRLYKDNVKVFSNKMLFLNESLLNASSINFINNLNDELDKLNIQILQSDDYNFFNLKIRDDIIKYYELGDGYIQLINIISEIVEIKQKNVPAILYIDEFNTSFHPELSKQLLKYLMSAEIECVMTIHSVDFLSKEITANEHIELFKVKNKETLEIEQLDFWAAYNLLDIEMIKSSKKIIVFTESEIDAAIYKKFMNILNLNNCEFIGLRGIGEIPKALEKFDMPNVFGIIDADRKEYTKSIQTFIDQKRIYVYEEMYTLENIIYNPINIHRLLGIKLEECKELKDFLSSDTQTITYEKDYIQDKYFASKGYSDFLKSNYCDIFVAHCYKNNKLDFLERKKTILKLKKGKFISKKENFPKKFIEMLVQLDKQGET